MSRLGIRKAQSIVRRRIRRPNALDPLTRPPCPRVASHRSLTPPTPLRRRLERVEVECPTQSPRVTSAQKADMSDMWTCKARNCPSLWTLSDLSEMSARRAEICLSMSLMSDMSSLTPQSGQDARICCVSDSSDKSGQVRFVRWVRRNGLSSSSRRQLSTHTKMPPVWRALWGRFRPRRWRSASRASRSWPGSSSSR